MPPNCNRKWRNTLRGENVAITAKQMAHRDIPVVFHHINFTPVLPVSQKCDKTETGSRKEKCGKGDMEDPRKKNTKKEK